MKLLLNNGREMYGLQFVKCSNGGIKRGTLYTTLSRMEDKGLVESRKETDPPEGLFAPRRLYSISGLGRRTLSQWEIDQIAMITGVSQL